MNKYTIFWIMWATVGAVIEVVTLTNKMEGDTLSEQVWILMNRRPFYVWLISFLLIWAFVHFLTKGKWA
jgi:hypothetical protein